MKKLNKFKVITVLAAVPLLSIFLYPVASFAAATKVDLGNASSFGAFSNTTVTNTGNTVISGTAGSLVGVSPGTAITGFPSPGTSGGITHTGTDSLAQSALIAAQAAYDYARNTTSEPVTQTLTGGSALNAQILDSGVYALSAPNLTGTLTLDGQNNPNAVFVFTTTSTLNTVGGSVVQLINGADACNVFWAVGSSATLNDTSTFVGHIVAHDAITTPGATGGASVEGSLVGLNAGVTLNNTKITNNNCAPAVVAVPIPAAVQQSTITSVTPSNCVTTGSTAIRLNGNFPTPVSNITVNGIAVAAGSWTQTAETVSVNAITSGTIPIVIQIYNGQVPVLAAQSFTCTPVAVVIPTPTPTPTPTPVVTPVAPGTIHVVKTVVNGFGGTATAADFTLSLRHHGIDVAGSPDVGMSSPGRTYVLAPGTYVLGEAVNPAFPNYLSSFSVVGQATNDIILTSGADLTVIETNTQLAPLVVATAPPVVATPPPVVVKPVTGGKLPKTGSPWYNMLLLSAGLVLLGGVGARFGKTARNK